MLAASSKASNAPLVAVEGVDLRPRLRFGLDFCATPFVRLPEIGHADACNGFGVFSNFDLVFAPSFTLAFFPVTAAAAAAAVVSEPNASTSAAFNCPARLSDER